MALKLSNNAKSNLSAALSASATSVTLASAANFPTLAVGDWHPLTLISSTGSYEIVRVTARSGNTLTITRAQEGTTGIAFAVGAVAELRMTEAAFNEFAKSGVSNFTVLNGINYSVSTGVANSGNYAITVDQIGAYANGLFVSVLPHSDNPAGTFTVNLNSLGSIPVRLPDGTIPPAGSVVANRTMHLRYQASSNRFILENAIPPGQIAASDTQAGLAQRGTDEDFDTNGDNEKFTTQRTVSRIIEDSQPAADNWPHIWSYYGEAREGGTYIPTVAPAGNIGQLSSAVALEFENLDVQAGTTLTLTGNTTAVIRCRTSITIAGTVQMNNRTGRVRAGEHVGPNGGTPTSTTNVQDRQSVRPSRRGDAMTAEELLYYIKNGTPMSDFHGGQGAYSTGEAVDAGGGLILIAPSITIEAGASFLGLYSVAANGSFGAPNGAGIIVLVGESVAVNASAIYEAGAQGSTNTGTHWNAELNLGNTDNAGAQNAGVYVVRINQNDVVRVF